MDLVSFFLFFSENEMKSGVFNYIQRGELKNAPNESLHKGDHFYYHIISIVYNLFGILLH